MAIALSYACPHGQRDRCGHVTLIRVIASLVSRLRPRRMLLGLPLARNQRATSAPDPKEDRWAAFRNDGAMHGLKSMRRRVASNASAAALALTSREAISSQCLPHFGDPFSQRPWIDGWDDMPIQSWRILHCRIAGPTCDVTNRGPLHRGLEEKVQRLSHCQWFRTKMGSLSQSNQAFLVTP